MKVIDNLWHGMLIKNTINIIKNLNKKSCIRETLNLSTDADHRTNIFLFLIFFFFFGGGGEKKKEKSDT